MGNAETEGKRRSQKDRSLNFGKPEREQREEKQKAKRRSQKARTCFPKYVRGWAADQARRSELATRTRWKIAEAFFGGGAGCRLLGVVVGSVGAEFLDVFKGGEGKGRGWGWG
ncbi:hypothetical protein C1H46_038110 [Malus baccata]|uniref:Uncharacterized protein n=1 Tax=Malus baccata TaxID=106549 RepID=A0A540KQ71_MALBA|nr:hypothetical protein C1H46_038110 [Malus baccata]